MIPLRLIIIACLLYTPFVCQAQTVSLTPSELGLRVEIDGKLFSEYRTTDAQRPYMYPITGPSGENLARPYPMEKGGAEDHPHHRSMWFTHGGVNGVDFWGNGEKNGTIKHTGFEQMKAEGAVGSFVAKSNWVLPGGESVMTDDRLIRIEALAGGGTIVDWTIKMMASAGDVTFNDTKEGSFALRLCPSLSIKESKEAHITTSEGATDKKAWGTRAKWVTFHGPDPKGNAVSVTVFDHPQNLRHPTWWHARDYGLFAANPFGIHDFEKDADKTKGNHVLPKGQAMTQRYRVLIESGNPDQAKLAEKFAVFGGS
jgi:Methane oxygenase PmoA